MLSPNPLFKFLAIGTITAALLAMPPLLADDTEKPEAEATPAERLNVPVPEGVPIKGITIPHYNDDGELAMRFEADEARRVSDNLIEMDHLSIKILDSEKPYDIQMEASKFDLDTRILTSDTQVTIKREDFEIIGDSAQFDVKTRESKMFGNVKMTIFNADTTQ